MSRPEALLAWRGSEPAQPLRHDTGHGRKLALLGGLAVVQAVALVDLGISMARYTGLLHSTEHGPPPGPSGSSTTLSPAAVSQDDPGLKSVTTGTVPTSSTRASAVANTASSSSTTSAPRSTTASRSSTTNARHRR